MATGGRVRGAESIKSMVRRSDQYNGRGRSDCKTRQGHVRGLAFTLREAAGHLSAEEGRDLTSSRRIAVALL